MYSREDVVKLLLTKRGVDPFSTGGVSVVFSFSSRFQNRVEIQKQTLIYCFYDANYKLRV